MTLLTLFGFFFPYMLFGPYSIVFALFIVLVVFAIDINHKERMNKKIREQKTKAEADRENKEEEAKKETIKVDLEKQTDDSKHDAGISKKEQKFEAASEESGTNKGVEKESAKVSERANMKIPKPKIKFKMPDKNLYNVLLMTLGVVFVLLAGIIFATTNWHIMPGFTKLLCILFVVVSVYTLSFFAERKFKLSFISRSLYILASFLLFMAVIAIAYFKLVGIYLTLAEATRYLAFFVASLATEISLLLALKKFNKRWYTDICLYGISVCICFLVMAFNMPLAFTITYLAVYAIICVIVDLYIEKSKTDLISKELKTDISAFAQTNLLAVSIMVMFFFRRNLHQGIVTIVLSIVHLYLGDKRENKINSAGFVIFLALAIYRIAYGNFEHSILYMLCMLLSIFASVNMIGTFRQNTRTYANIASIISCVAIMIGVCYYFVIDGGITSFASMLSLILVWLYILINDIKYKNEKISLLNILVFMFLINYSLAYFEVGSYTLCSLINVVIFSIMVVFRKQLTVNYKAWLACVVNLSFFTAFAFWDYYSGYSLIYSISGLYTIICILLSIFVYYLLSKENVIFGFFIPGFYAALIYILVGYASIKVNLSFEWVLFTCLLFACAYKLVRRRRIDVGLVIWINIFGIIYSLGYLSEIAIPAPYLILAGIYLLLHLIMSKENKDTGYHVIMLADLLSGVFVSLYFSGLELIAIQIILAVTMLAISVLYRYVIREKAIANLMDVIVLLLEINSIFIYIVDTSTMSLSKILIYSLLITALCVLYNVKAYMEKRHIRLLVNATAFWLLFMTRFMLVMIIEKEYSIITTVIILTLIMFAVLRYKAPIAKEEKLKLSSCDWWSIMWGSHIVFMMFALSVAFYTRYIRSVYVLLLALYFLQYIKVKKLRALAQVGSAICFVIFMWTQDLVSVASVYDFEVMVFSLLAIPISFKGLINNKEYRVINVLSRTAVLLILTGEAVAGTNIENSIIVLVFAVVLLVYTSIRKHRKEFLIAFSFAITIAVFMTRTFWTSVSWFAYLFAAGLLLIALAVYNETRRKKQEAKAGNSEVKNESNNDNVTDSDGKIDNDNVRDSAAETDSDNEINNED